MTATGIPFGEIPGLLLKSSYLVFLTLGVSVILSTGEIDLSVFGVSSLTAILTLCVTSVLHLHTSAIIILTLFFAVSLSLINAILVIWLKLDSLLVTLASFSAYYGGAMIVYLKTTNLGNNPYILPDAVKSSSWKPFFGVRLEVLILVLTLVALWLLLNKTKLGVSLKAIGQNPVSALYSGVKLGKIRFIAFLIAGILYGIGSFLDYSRFSSTRPSDLLQDSVTPILCAIISGAEIRGGRLPVFFVVIGVGTFLALKELVMAQEYLPSESYNAVFGIVLLIYIFVRYWTRPTWRTA
jgi:rhamnose transport system permease protein